MWIGKKGIFFQLFITNRRDKRKGFLEGMEKWLKKIKEIVRMGKMGGQREKRKRKREIEGGWQEMEAEMRTGGDNFQILSKIPLQQYRSQRMSRSMKSSKSEDIGIHKIPHPPIQRYARFPPHQHFLPKPLPSSSPNCQHQNQPKNEPLVRRYETLLSNLREHRLIVDEHMSREASKNHALYLELMKTIEKNRIKTENWISNRIRDVHKIFDQYLLNIQQKIYQLTHKLTSPNSHQQFVEFEHMKQFQIPLFKFNPINLKSFQLLIKTYSVITEEHKNVEFTRESGWKKKGKKQRKSMDFDLECKENIEWEGSKSTQKKKNLMEFSQIIIQQSQSQENSLISANECK